MKLSITGVSQTILAMGNATEYAKFTPEFQENNKKYFLVTIQNRWTVAVLINKGTADANSYNLAATTGEKQIKIADLSELQIISAGATNSDVYITNF